MTLTVSFGGHLQASDFARLHQDLRISDHHILEVTPIARFRTASFETPQSFQRFRDKLEKEFKETRLASWKEVIELAQLGRFHKIRLDEGLRTDPMVGRLLLLSEENERRTASGKSPVRIHFEPLTENILSQALNVGAFHNNADFAFGKGDLKRFIENNRLLIEGRVRHYEMRNREILNLAERLHSNPQIRVSADLGALHRHHFERIAEESRIPVEMKNREYALNPFERLIDRVAQGHAVESIPDEDFARAGVSGLLLPGFKMKVEPVDDFMKGVSFEDIQTLFNKIRGSKDPWRQVLSNWILGIHHRQTGR